MRFVEVIARGNIHRKPMNVLVQGQFSLKKRISAKKEYICGVASNISHQVETI